ncbi:MAG: efflux RND transporter periplasmic adaptor subunit [Balneolaceae bacterium]
MKNQNKLTLALISAFLVMSCSTPDAEQITENNELRTVNVETEIISPETFESFLRQVGTVSTAEDIQIAAEIGGRITGISIREGSRVNAGDLILKIDDRRLQQEVRRLTAVTEQSRENYERLQRLYEEDEIGSEIELLNARYTYEQNQAALESTQIDLESTMVKAPFSGIVEDILMEKGETVSAGTPVVRMISDGGKKIRVGVPARFADVVDVGDEAEIWFDFDEENRYKLPITSVGNSIDSQNRTFRVDIALPEDFRNVKIDMIANVRLRTERIENVIIVYEEYVFRKNGNPVAYVVEENDEGDVVAKERVLEMGASYGNQTIVKDGLQTGDEIVTLGSSYLQDGTRVEKTRNGTEFTQN